MSENKKGEFITKITDEEADVINSIPEDVSIHIMMLALIDAQGENEKKRKTWWKSMREKYGIQVEEMMFDHTTNGIYTIKDKKDTDKTK